MLPSSLLFQSVVKAPYYYPDEGGTPDVNLGEDSSDDEDDNEEEDDSDDNEDKESEEEDGLEAKGDKDKEEEPTLARVEYSAIKEKFPDFFKTFPELKHAFFREQQFTEIFPTVEDAKRAAEKELAYDEITNAVVEGDANKFINELADENKDGLEQFAKNFLPSLQEHDKDLYFETIAPTVQGFVKNVYDIGLRDKDPNVQNAAKIVHKLLFGGGYDDIEKEGGTLRTSGKTRDKDDSVEKDKQKYFQTKYQNLYQDVTKACYDNLDGEIAKGLEDIKKSRPGLMRVITKDIRERILSDMEKDQAYLGRMQGLWKREQRSGFNGTLKNSFTTTFIAKAKTLIPKYRSEVRREVLGKEDINGNKNGDSREPNRLTGNRNSNTSGKGKMTPERQRAEKLSTRQVFD